MNADPILRMLLVAGGAVTVTVAGAAAASPPGGGASRFEVGVSRGALDDPALDEISGIAPSARYPGMFWALNDSGERGGRIFLIDGEGRRRATVNLSRTENRDWESIAVGPGPAKDVSYVYIGDTGDNDERYAEHVIYRLPEPKAALVEGAAVTATAATPVDSLRYRYERGTPDAEALMIDPWTRDLYVISKRKSGGDLFSIRYPQPTGEIAVARRLGALPLTEIVAADISASGDEIIMKNYDRVFYWERRRDDSVLATVTRKPQRPPYEVEPQGESIAFPLDGRGFYTLSERAHAAPPLMFYKRKS